MFSTRLSSISLALLSYLSISAVVFADDEKNKDSTLSIGEVIEVYAQNNSAKDAQLVGSVDVINRDQLQNEHVNNTIDLFTKIPGVYFSRFNQGIVSTDIAMRGFNGEGSMPHTKLLIDGIPSNLHIGSGEMDALFPMEVESIEVVKGNQDARYGLHNLAGNINMRSRRDDANEIEVLVGSFDTYEAQGYFGNVGDTFSQHYFVGARDTKGYRDHSALEKHTFSGKWFYQPSNNTELGVIARYFDYKALAPGYLTEEEAHRDPTQSADYAQNDSGDKQTRHLSAHLDHAFDEIWQLSVKSYIQQFERHRYTQYTASSSQQERLEKDKQYGAIATLSATLSPEWLFSMGMDYQAQDNSNERFVTIEKQRQTQSRNWDFDYKNYGGFTQLQYRNERLLISGGLRFDGFSGDLYDGVSQENKAINDEGITLQPKFNVLYEITDRMNIFANYGVSFQAPTGSQAYISEQSSGFDLSKNYGFETGVKWQLFDWLNTRLSVWQQDAKQELTPKTDGSGDFDNIGKTERKGWDLALSVDVNTQWSGFASYTRQEAKLVEPGEANIEQQGNWLLGVPDFTATAGVIYRPVNKLKVSLFGHFQGNYYISNVIQEKKYGGYKLVDLSFDYDLGWGNAGVRVNNLFDSYADYVYLLGSETIHSPTDGRSIDLSLSYRF